MLKTSTFFPDYDYTATSYSEYIEMCIGVAFEFMATDSMVTSSDLCELATEVEQIPIIALQFANLVPEQELAIKDCVESYRSIISELVAHLQMHACEIQISGVTVK
jgi:hypothetical protein